MGEGLRSLPLQEASEAWMRVCSRFTRRLTPHHHPHPTAASSLTLTSLRILPPSRGKEGTASCPRASAGLRQGERTRRFAAGVCLGTTGLAGLPRVANVRAQEKHKRHPDRPCRDEHPAGRARSLPPDFSRLIATVWWSRRSRRPHGAGLVGPTSQPLHTRRVLERITELALFVKNNRRPGLDPGPVPLRIRARPRTKSGSTKVRLDGHTKKPRYLAAAGPSLCRSGSDQWTFLPFFSAQMFL
jgi:hypothetical protein